MTIDVLPLLARANLAASVAIVAVALLRRPVRAAFGAPAAYRLWAVPLAMALASLLPAPDGGPIAPLVLAASGAMPAVASLGRGFTWPAWVAHVWVVGALVCAGVLAARQARFARALRGARRLHVGGRAVIRAARPDVGPAVAGGAIVLPADFEVRFTPAEQAAILAHEIQHLARGDVVANGVVAAAQCLCWFNPLVHLAARWLRFDQELACDAAVIAARPSLRRPYAEALLKTQAVGVVPPVGCAWRARGFPTLRQRILLLKRAEPSRSRRALGALVLTMLTVGGGYAAWAQPLGGALVRHPEWLSRPTGADLARFYPHDAEAHRLGGSTLMQCRVRPDGTLAACAIVREAPRGAGFGKAALQMAPRFRMKPTGGDGRPVAGGVVRIPILFKIAGPPPARR